MSTVLGTHNIDVFSLSNPEVATFGNLSNEVRIRLYDKNSQNGAGGYLISMSNTRLSFYKETGTTQIGIGTTFVYPSANLQVQGTVMTSNISTYNSDNNIYFNNQSIAGLSNISFSGTLIQSGTTYRTTQWTSTPNSDITFNGNVGIGVGASNITTFGNTCNLLVIGNMLVTGNITGSSFTNAGGVTGVYNNISLYNASGDGSKTIITNDSITSNCILYSFNLYAGRYIITANLSYQNLTPMVAIDSANWANIGLYQCSPSALTTNTTPLRYEQITAVGSYISTDVESISISWFLDITATNQPPYVIAVLGKGHQLKFAPANIGTSSYLYTIPLRGIGYDDQISVRQALQVSPFRYTNSSIPTATSIFQVAGSGFYTAVNSNVDFYVTAAGSTKKLSWLTDFNISYTFDSAASQTTFNIITTAQVAQSSAVDIAVWAQVSASTYYSSGYLYQQINTSSSPWLNVATGGARLSSSCFIDGDLYIKGNVFGGCNTTLFPAGVAYTGTTAINVAANTIGTTNLIDGAVTSSKLNLTTGNVGIGTSITNYTLDVYGTSHFLNNAKFDSYVFTSLLGVSGTPLSILGCTNPLVQMYSLTTETGALTAGTSIITIQAPYPMNILSTKLPKFTVNVVPASGTYTFNITKNGTNIYSSNPTIASGASNSTYGGSSQGTLVTNPTTVNENDILVASVVSVGTSAVGGKVFIYST